MRATYLVRTQADKRLVGVFAANGPGTLFCTIDEVLDPGLCEYLEIGNGEGVFIDGKFRTETQDGVTYEALAGYAGEGDTGIAMSEHLQYRVNPDSSPAWKRFTDVNIREFVLPRGAVDTAAGRAGLRSFTAAR